MSVLPLFVDPAVTVVPLNILVLSQRYWPDVPAAGQLITDVCEDLAAAGHNVTVICGRHVLASPVRAEDLLEQHNGVRIVRVWSHQPNERGVANRLVHYGSYFAASIAAALRGSKPDVCLVISSPPLLLGLSGTLLQVLRGVPFVYAVHDLYPDIAYHLGVLRKDGALARVIEPISNALYRAASAVITLSDGMKDRLIAKAVAAERITVIPNWADSGEITESERDNEFSRAHVDAREFVVQYSGNLGESQGLESLIGAARILREYPVSFSIVGQGNARAQLERLTVEHQLSNVRFAPPQPRTKLSLVLASADVGTVLMRRGLAKDLVPCKLYGIMASARPVLASVEADSEVARVVAKHDCGWVVSPESSESLANGVLSAWRASPETRKHLGVNGRRACMEHYERRTQTQKYMHVLTHVANSPHLGRAQTG